MRRLRIPQLRKVLLAAALLFAFTGLWLAASEPAQLVQASRLSDEVEGVDHSQFEVLKRTFETPQDVTNVCLACHTDAGDEIQHTTHWTWEFINEETGQVVGKKTLINNFCVGIQSNEPRCTSCHIGYGWKDNTFDFSAQENIDCLVCHDTSGTYAKFPSGAGYPVLGEAKEFKGKAYEPVDLSVVAQSVGRTTRQTCGNCHFYGGGGDAVKHGDLDSSLITPPYELDVHMSLEGGNFSCTTCHVTTDHDIPGSRYSMDPEYWQGCTSCHTEDPHPLTLLNVHAQRVACQTCHIPEFARGGIATKMTWDWSTAGELEDGKPVTRKDGQDQVIYDGQKGSFTWAENVVPRYGWFNGVVSYNLAGDVINPDEVVSINHFEGSKEDPNALIWPFKRFDAIQPYDSGNKTLVIPHLFPSNAEDTDAYWKGYDWDAAIASGMAYASLPYSGEYDWVTTEMYWPATHMVAPASDALTCLDCHTSDGRLDFAELGYSQEDVYRLSNFPPTLTIELKNRQLSSPETCKQCHDQQYGLWVESKHSTKSVSCISCHHLEGELEHPLSPYTSSRLSDVCGACHLEEFRDWENSVHGEKGLSCATCHEPHAQYQRISGDPQSTSCDTCHVEQSDTYQHAVHKEAGLNCNECHKNTDLNTGHTFEIGSDTCLKCHAENIHGAASAFAEGDVQQGETPADREDAETSDAHLDEPEAPTGTGIGLPGWMLILFGVLLGAGVYWLVTYPGLSQRSNVPDKKEDK